MTTRPPPRSPTSHRVKLVSISGGENQGWVTRIARIDALSFANHPEEPPRAVRTMSQDRIVGARLILSMRTTRFSEYRSPEGALLLFEIAPRLTNFGLLCAKLAEMPGVEFKDRIQPVKYTGPAHFRYKETDYEVSIPHEAYRIGVLDCSTAPAHLEELMEYVKQKVTPPQRLATRTFY